MFNPQFEKTIKMCETMAKTHQGEINYLTLDWQVVDVYDARYPDQLFQQIVPLLVIDFK